jgi:Lrp/AsnC family transcriptional regulator, leucine-responsive regulatory protein
MLAFMPSNQRSNGEIIDEINGQLLTELQDDARLSLAELARRVNLSPPAVAERLQRLEAAGVIRGYHADIDPVAAGYPLSAIIRVRPTPRQLVKVAEVARAAPEVVECHRITGEDCFLLKAHVRDVTHLEELIDSIAVYGQTTTSIMQSSPVPGRGIAMATSARSLRAVQ